MGEPNDDNEPLPLPTPVSGTLQSSLNGFRLTDPVAFAQTFPINQWCIGVQYCPRNKRNRTTAIQVCRGAYQKKTDTQLAGFRTRGGFGNQITLKISNGRGSLKIYASPQSGWSVSGTGVKGLEPMHALMDALVKLLNDSNDICGYTRDAMGVRYTREAVEVSCLNFHHKLRHWTHDSSGSRYVEYLKKQGYHVHRLTTNGGFLHYCYNDMHDRRVANPGVCTCHYIDGCPIVGLKPCRKPEKKHGSKGTGSSIGDCRVLTVRVTAKGSLMIWGADSCLQAGEVVASLDQAFDTFQRNEPQTLKPKVHHRRRKRKTSNKRQQKKAKTRQYQSANEENVPSLSAIHAVPVPDTMPDSTPVIDAIPVDNTNMI